MVIQQFWSATDGCCWYCGWVKWFVVYPFIGCTCDDSNRAWAPSKYRDLFPERSEYVQFKSKYLVYVYKPATQYIHSVNYHAKSTMVQASIDLITHVWPHHNRVMYAMRMWMSVCVWVLVYVWLKILHQGYIKGGMCIANCFAIETEGWLTVINVLLQSVYTRTFKHNIQANLIGI